MHWWQSDNLYIIDIFCKANSVPCVIMSWWHDGIYAHVHARTHTAQRWIKNLRWYESETVLNHISTSKRWTKKCFKTVLYHLHPSLCFVGIYRLTHYQKATSAIYNEDYGTRRLRLTNHPTGQSSCLFCPCTSHLKAENISPILQANIYYAINNVL